MHLKIAKNHKKRAGNVYETFAGSKPRYAVCYVVLNLHIAGGIWQKGFALAVAYRVSPRSSKPLFLVLAQNYEWHHQHSRVANINTTFKTP